MKKTRSVFITLLFVFCIINTIAYSEPTEDLDKAWQIIKEKWFNSEFDSESAIGISKDIKEPIKVLTKLNEIYGSSQELRGFFLLLLGECYFLGEGIEKNNEMAFKYFSQSAKEGNEDGKYRLLELSIKSINNEKDSISIKEAEDCLKGLANSNFDKAKTLLALFAFEGKTKCISITEAGKYLKDSVDKDDDIVKNGLYLLLNPFFNNQDNNISIKEAEDCLKELANNGSYQSKYMLAILALSGKTNCITLAEAEKYLKESAENDYVEAKYDLAKLILRNKICTISKEKAVEYMNQAASSGYREAINYILYNVNDIPLDKIISWLILSVEKGDNNSLLDLADIYPKMSKTLSENDKERIKNCIDKIKKLAEKNDKEAMKQLAVLYTKDKFDFLAKDTVRAKYWIKKYQEELDNIFDKEIAMLEFYIASGNGELADLETKKIIKNIRQFDISAITPKNLDYFLTIVNISYSKYCFSILSGLEIEDNSKDYFEKDDYYRRFSPVISEDKDFVKYYVSYMKPIKNKIKINHLHFDKEDYKILYLLANKKNGIWLNAINKYYKTNKESEEIIKVLNNYFDEIGYKIDSKLDLEDYQAIKKVIEKAENDKKIMDYSIPLFLFDGPTIIACRMTSKKLSDDSIEDDEKKKIARTFSIITSNSLPYSVDNRTKDEWFNTCKIIKQNLSENDYKDLQNYSVKLIPDLDLPKNTKIKWP